jgi:hypothetical protein
LGRIEVEVEDADEDEEKESTLRRRTEGGIGVGREERGDRMSLPECNLEAALALPGAQWTGLGCVAASLRCCASAGLSCTRESLFVRANPDAPFFARRSANFGIASLLAVPDPWIGRSCKRPR